MQLNWLVTMILMIDIVMYIDPLINESKLLIPHQITALLHEKQGKDHKKCVISSHEHNGGTLSHNFFMAYAFGEK